MNWDAVSAIAEMVGAIVVVASLVYVGRQLGQNTATMRVSAASERLERDYELVLPVIEDRAFAEVWLRGDGEFEALDEVDKQRLLFFERRAIALWHHIYQLQQQKLLPDANWHEQVWVIQKIGRRQAVREAWKRFGEGFERPFQDFVESQFAIADKESAG